ncbi:uncharacterized protein (TIGR02001 family) [Caulobacter ginsengisoli]|uniref:Uncharacterized protein (TIGR02001 family) n=1 Tax=Caulobacter ginsengisoli TaxID=400775 RepID=A0ABU0IKF2_9CAUL|nr:TorF family putative porin [Caulobacter ginsengisoli]MDQ0462490.1 uncharacterized protein (TIGR02001 family) [Caulobacter ginsengisoli]
MKTWKLALAAAAASLSMGGVALADDAPAVTFNVGVASDYVFRGVSQTDESVQVFGGADVTSGIFYAGVWASNVDFGDDTSAEVDGYFGVKPTVGAVNLDIGAVYYGYVNAPSGSDYGYWEGKIAGSVPAGPLTLGAAAYYSPDFFGGVGDALYYEVNASGSPADKWTVSGALGHQTIDDFSVLDYTTWNLGVSYAFTDKISADLRYHDSDIDFCSSICDSRVVLSLKATLP